MSWKIASSSMSIAQQKSKSSSRSRNGASTSSSYYPPIYHQQQQQYFQQISKAQRSKSMDDFGSHMVFEQSSRVQRNNARNGNGYQQRSPSQMGKRSPSQNGLSRMNNHQAQQPQHKNQMRYSVDNLLEIDTSYYNNYQVRGNMKKLQEQLQATLYVVINLIEGSCNPLRDHVVQINEQK